MPKSLFFLSLLFGGKTQSYWLPVSPVAPCPPLSFNPISPPFRNALQSFFCTRLPFFSRPLCPIGSLGAVCVFGCSRSIHPLWWNRIQWPPLCPVVPIPGSCLLSVRDWELVRGDEVTQWLIRRKAKNARLLGITDRWYWIRVNRPKVISVYVNTLDRILRAIWCAVLFWLPWRKPYI